MTSDLHGFLPKIPQCDLLLIAGDICPDQEQDRWLFQEFMPWAEESPAENVVFIGGNHDFILQKNGFVSTSKVHYLLDAQVEIAGLKIWGTPWGRFGRWAFSKEEADLREVYAQIPEDTDIVMTHAPPRGILDVVGGMNVGAPYLASRISQTSARCVLFGHIHECFGAVDMGIPFVNASYMDENFYRRMKGFFMHDWKPEEIYLS